MNPPPAEAPAPPDVVYLHPLPTPADSGLGPGATYPVIPVGLVGHVNLLRADGWTVQGLNLGVARTVDPGFDLVGWLRSRSAPALVLIDLHWYEHVWGALSLAGTVRAAWPHARIVLGGLSATHFHLDILAGHPAVDAVVCGAAEAPVRRLVADAAGGTWAPLEVANVAARDGAGRPRRSQEAWQTPSELLDRLDTVDLAWLEHADAYRRMVHSRPLRVVDPSAAGQWVLSGRGCAFACGYCGGGREAHRVLSGLRRVARREPARLAADVERLYALGVHQVAPSLDPDMLGSAHRAAFFRQLSGGAGLYVESYQLPSVDLLDQLARSTDLDHTEVALTPLTGDLDVRRRHGKRYDDTQLVAAVSAAAERGIAVFVFFSLNLPGTSRRTVAATTDLVRRLRDVAPADGLRAISICHTLDPVSPMALRPADFSIRSVHLRSLDDYLAYARAPRPFPLTDRARGFELVERRDLPRMVAAWDALADETPRQVYRVPRV